MKLFIFTRDTNYGEFVRVIAAITREEAFNTSSKNSKSLKDLGWRLSDGEKLTVPSTTEILFDGGGAIG